MSEEQIQNKIKKDAPIADIIAEFPELIEVFLEYGLHCVTCHISQFETLEQGAKRHGMSKEDISMMLRDANKAISEVQYNLEEDN